ncbi:MAG: DUF4190 domain-containing protein [Planctomycetota bacterium]
MDQMQARTSGLGLLSLLCALISIGACAVAALLAMVLDPLAAGAIAVLPLFGIAAIILGGIALAKTPGDGIRRTRGPAGAGLILGIIATVLQGSAVAGALLRFFPVKNLIAPIVQEMAFDVEAGRTEEARDQLAEYVRSNVPPERIEAFFDVAAQAVGTFDRTEVTLFGTFVRSSRAFRDAPGGTAPPPHITPFPVELVGDSGRTLLWIMLDDAALEKEQVLVTDMILLLPNDRCAVLLPEAQLAQLAAAVGWQIVNPLPAQQTPSD